MQLYIGNKNYSSWSLRPWLLMKQAGIAFDEVALRFEDFAEDTHFKRVVLPINPAGKVPVLVDDGFAVWDSLAIAEYLHDKFPERHLWPVEPRRRARARSVCAEMHSGFGALRKAFPMNMEAHLPEVGPRVLKETPAAQRDLDRVVQIWTDALQESGGPFLFGKFGIADAYYAPVGQRIAGYGLPVPAAASAYIERVRQLPALQAWTRDALAEHDWVADDEPYRTRPAG
jgi:glutathione S-transferase